MADAANTAPKISLIVITRNEEELIGQCLKSAAAFCDELIVVDSCSTDRTVEIARGLGARIFERTFDGYIAQKQFALEQAERRMGLLARRRRAGNLGIGQRNSHHARGPAAGRRLPCPPRALPSRPLLHSRTLPGLALAAISTRSRTLRRSRTACQRAWSRALVAKLNAPILHFSYRDVADHVATINRLSSQAATEANRARSPWSR